MSMRLLLFPLGERNNSDKYQISQKYQDIHTEHIQVKHKINLCSNILYKVQSFRVCSESSLLEYV